jgi:AcrR family transcriptional regulator
MSRSRNLKNTRARSRGRPVDEDARLVRRNRILTAARASFAAGGFHATSTATIARAAKLSVANLYQYFQSKDDLVLALVQQDLEADVALVVELGRQGPFPRAVESVLQGVLEERGKDEDGFRLRLEILAEATRNAAVRRALASAEAQVIQLLADQVGEAQSRGEIGRQESPETIARLLYLLADGAVSTADATTAKGRRSIEAVAQLIARVLGRGE